MKTNYALLLTAIVAVLTLIILRQLPHHVKPETTVKNNNIYSLTGGRTDDKNEKLDKISKEVMTTGIKVEVNFSSKKIFQMYCQPMMSRFSDSISLDENGGYPFTPNFNVDMRYQTMQFKYKVK